MWLLLVSSTVAAAPAKAVYERGKELYQAGHYDEAAPLFIEAFQLSRHPMLLFNAAQAYRKAGLRDQAIAALQWFLEQTQNVDPNVVNDARTILTTLEHPVLAEPETPTPPPSPKPAPAPAVYRNPYLTANTPSSEPPGWALGAGIQGIVFSTVTLALGLSSEATRNQQTPGLPLGIATTLLFAIDTPISAAGASSTRNQAHVPGIPGLRIAGWISFALALSGAVVLIAMGIAQVEPPPGVVATTSVLGTGGNLFLSIDSVATWRQARAKAEKKITWIGAGKFRF